MATPRKYPQYAVEAVEGPMIGAGYTRYSTVEQGSTKEQVSVNEDLADEHGIELVVSFKDEGVSRSLSDRPGLMKLFEYLEAHPEVRYLVVNELERLTGDIAQRQKIVTMCKRLNIAILTEDMGVINPHDDLKMQQADERAVRSKGEVLTGRRRTRRSLKAKVKSRTSVVMRPCYGIRMVPLVLPDGTELPSGMSMLDGSGKRIHSGQIEIHPNEYEWLVQIFEWSAAGASLGEIARQLNDAGVPTKSGKGLWSHATVRGILDNAFYKGEMTWGLQETRRHADGTKFSVIRRKGDPGRVDMESPLGAIIDPATWDRAHARRLLTASLPVERRRHPRQVLDGRVYCLRCGHKMYGRNSANSADRKRGVVTWTYMCHSRRPEFKPQSGFSNCTGPHSMTLAQILTSLAGESPPTTGQGVTVTHGANDAVNAAKRYQQERIVKARAAIERAEDLALEGDIPKEKLRAARTAQGAIIVDAEERIEALGEAPREVVIEPLETAVDRELFRDLVRLLSEERLPLDDRLAALDAFGLERVYVDKPLLRLQLGDGHAGVEGRQLGLQGGHGDG